MFSRLYVDIELCVINKIFFKTCKDKVCSDGDNDADDDDCDDDEVDDCENDDADSNHAAFISYYEYMWLSITILGDMY